MRLKSGRERVLPAIVTVAVLGAVVLWATLRSNNVPKQENLQPDEVIWSLVRACREGNVEGYLNCFGSPIRERLERLAKEQGNERFRNYLRQLVEPVKGIAVFEPQRNERGDWQIVAEFIFTDRTERQTFIVRKIEGRWKIVGIETAKQVPVLVPYGTPVKGL